MNQPQTLQQLKNYFCAVINEQIRKIESMAIKATQTLKSFETTEKLNNPESLIKLQERQEILYNEVYKPWIEEYEILKEKINHA